MTIQVPNPGTGNGATGDNEFVLWSKVKANFEDQTNAASRLVGTAFGQVLVMGNNGLADAGYSTKNPINTSWSDNSFPSGFYASTNRSASAFYESATRMVMRFDADNHIDLSFGVGTATMAARAVNNGVISDWATFYSNKNTTLDGNGALKPSSPVLRVFNDRIEGNADGDAMAATYTKNGVGDYTITGTTGLRTDGWYIVIPNDMNGNPKVAVGTLDDTDGVITLKTYARIFDMSTFKFVPDLKQPLDIPDGRWIDLRFNDVEIDDSDHVEV